jgi:hypothetical protein
VNEVTPAGARELLDQLLRMLAREAASCDRKAQTERANADQLHGADSRGLAGYALGYAEANENFARQLRALIAEAKGSVEC